MADDIHEELAEALLLAERDETSFVHTLDYHRTIATAVLSSPVIARIRAEALEQFAELLLQRYPHDIFTPLMPPEQDQINAALRSAGFVRDRISADMMRRAAQQAQWEAENIRDEASIRSETGGA